jgi:hypothetical protein
VWAGTRPSPLRVGSAQQPKLAHGAGAAHMMRVVHEVIVLVGRAVAHPTAVHRGPRRSKVRGVATHEARHTHRTSLLGRNLSVVVGR